MADAVMRAAIYTRISRDRLGVGAGVARQEEDCRALCEGRGWPVMGVFEDNDTSAYSTRRRRAGYQSMMDALADGQIDIIVAWHPDRLHRSPLELEGFIDAVEAAGVTVVTVQSGNLDLSSASGRMTARVVGAVARHESEQKSERIRRKHRQLAEQGKNSGGGPARPFGFQADRVIHDPMEADLIQDAVRRVIGGESIRSITKDWNRQGVTTTTGRPHYPSGVKRILRSARSGGFREAGGKLHPAVWQPIIAEPDFFHLRAILDDPGRRVNQRPRKYLLTGGLARCGLCGEKLVARPRSDGRRCYVCASDPHLGGCGKIRIMADPFEEFVQKWVIELLDGPELAAAVTEITAAEQREGDGHAEVVAIQAQQAELAEMWAAGRISTDEWERARDGLDERLQRATTDLQPTVKIQQAAVLTSHPEVLATRWGDMGLEERREVIAAVVERVDVGAAVRGRNFFDQERITVKLSF